MIQLYFCSKFNNLLLSIIIWIQPFFIPHFISFDYEMININLFTDFRKQVKVYTVSSNQLNRSYDQYVYILFIIHIAQVGIELKSPIKEKSERERKLLSICSILINFRFILILNLF